MASRSERGGWFLFSYQPIKFHIMGQRTELFVVEKLRDKQGRKIGYNVYSRRYQWGIGRTMPLHILAGVLAAYQGGYYHGIHIKDILPEVNAWCGHDRVIPESISWERLVNDIDRAWNNNGAIVVQIDNQRDKSGYECRPVINISFMLGPEDAGTIGKEAGAQISRKEWAQLNSHYMDSDTREFFRRSIKYVSELGPIKVNFKFDEKF